MIPATLTPYLLVFLIIIVLGLAITVSKLHNRIKKLTLGKYGSSLEETINAQSSNIQGQARAITQITDQVANLDKRVRSSIQGAETLRFNPFEGIGGNQSFATALLDEEGNGVVFSSLYSREKVSVFAKPVKSFASEYELSAEERKVISSRQVKYQK